MLQFSYDPDVGSVYVYFTELEEGQAVSVLEYPAALLLDARGRIFGIRLTFDDAVMPAQLDLALKHDYAYLDQSSGQFTVRIANEDPDRVVELYETAILDLDAHGQVLGVEVALPEELRTSEALERLAPFMIPLEEPVGEQGEGPVVLTRPAAEATERDETTVQDKASEATDDHPPAPVSRSGFVALVGKPNVGKSTLLNALLGQKIAIVSPKPQTTRVPLRGILTRPGAQIIFVDTPGIHQPSHALGRFMVELAERTLPNADVIGFMVDISQPPSQLDRRIAEQVQRARGRKLLILNKVDLKPRGRRTYLEDYRGLGPWELEIAISALKGLGLSALLEAIVERLPEGPPLYPEDQLTDQSEQFLAAEFVREKVLYYTQQEVPHAVAIEVEEWEQRGEVTYIRMTINVEREGQKAIIIGAGGAMLKKIGSAARQDIERLIGKPVFLDLWVKVRPNWRDDVGALGWLGYRLKDWS